MSVGVICQPASWLFCLAPKQHTVALSVGYTSGCVGRRRQAPKEVCCPLFGMLAAADLTKNVARIAEEAVDRFDLSC
jgi:hypothetical protein